MRILPAFAALVIVAASPSFAAEPLRILPIGDSITHGGKRNVEEFTYRLPLQQLLKEAGIAFDFIGTRNKGLDEDAKWPDVSGAPFDPDHEGYYGWKTAAVRDKLRENLPKLPPPDFALIHLGTNDQDNKDRTGAVVQPLEEMVGLLRKQNPRVAVLIGHLNFQSGTAAEIRTLVDAMAERLNTKESPVVTVHHYRGWKENPKDEGTDTFDWAHPNRQGQKKMADAWFAAMKPLLKTK
ncbi:MAG TPA: GDSL-type esterase/lipase family protein [Chthoniobacteraceae bacterium]|jgi:lysophospholipase L1-like esterase